MEVSFCPVIRSILSDDVGDTTIPGINEFVNYVRMHRLNQTMLGENLDQYGSTGMW